MEFVADESLSGDIVSALRAQGLNVYYVAEHSASLPDMDVLALAVGKRAVLLTEDKDFGELVYHAQQPHVGIVLFRLDGLPLHEKVARAIMAINANAPRLSGNFMVVDPRRVRISRET